MITFTFQLKPKNLETFSHRRNKIAETAKSKPDSNRKLLPPFSISFLLATASMLLSFSPLMAYSIYFEIISTVA